MAYYIPHMAEKRKSLLLGGNAAQFHGDEPDIVFPSMVDSKKQPI
jgi:hypothetical protein